MKFCILSILYLFVLFGSIYGLFVEQVAFKLGPNPNFHLVLIGWKKNLICSLGLLAAASVAVYPVLLAVYNALTKANN